MTIFSSQEVRKLDDKKLSSSLAEVGRQLVEARLQHAQQQLKDSSLLKKYRRHKARLKTIARERALERNTSVVSSSS